MGLVRLKVREFAAEKGWTLKEVSERSGVIYSTVRHYARCPGVSTIDFISIHKLARTFDVMIEDLVEIVQEWAIAIYDKIIKNWSSFLSMGLIRLRVREFAGEKGWTIKEVSDRSGVVYSTLRTYARSPGLATVDVTVLHKLARTFDLPIEELYEIVQE
jgi:putative transcriptional regulator